MKHTLTGRLSGLLLGAALLLGACSQGASAGQNGGAAQPQTPAPTDQTAGAEGAQGTADPNHPVIKFGATSGDFADQIKDGIKPILEKQGYKVELTEFTDYVRPNLALDEGSIDVNVFQHLPYLNEFKATRKLNLSELVEVPTAPFGVYAGKLKSLDNAPDGASVGVPNDPSNLARSLVILKDLGWIELDSAIDPLTVSVKDIKSNKKNLKLIELEAAQLPRSRDDVDFAMINGNYAVSAGIPLTDALLIEPSFAFINWAVVKTENLDAQWAQDVKKAYESDAFQQYANKTFPGYKFPSFWKPVEGGAQPSPANDGANAEGGEKAETATPEAPAAETPAAETAPAHP